MKITFFTFFFFIAIPFAFSQNIPENTPDKIVKDFFEVYPKNAEKALDNLYATNKWTSKNTEGLAKLKAEVAKLTVDFLGEYNGYDELYKKDLANRFVIQSYLVRYDRQPIRFTFVLYKPKDKWGLYYFKFDSSLDAELEESNKVINNIKKN